MSHTDYINTLPAGFAVNASTPHCPCAGMEDAANGLYAVQFHPEVLHTVNGAQMLKNFLFEICGCAGDWRMDSFVETSVAAIREQIGDSPGALRLVGRCGFLGGRRNGGQGGGQPADLHFCG